MKTIYLEDLSIGGGRYGIGASAVDYNPNLPTYLRITDIRDDGTLDLSSKKSVEDPEANNYMLRPGDIVFARTGNSTGRNYFYDERDGAFAYAGFLIKFSLDPEKVNPRYVKYYAQSKPYWDWVASFNTGSTRGNINAKTYGKLPILLPEREKQDAIVLFCDSISDKIRINSQLNDYLLEFGDALFARALKENEQKISYQPIGTFCEVKGGKRLPKGSDLISEANSHPYIRVRDLNNASVLLLTPEMLYVDDETQASISRYIVNAGDVIVSVVGTIGLTAYIGNTLDGANLTENCNKLTSFNGDLAAWSYFFLRSPAGVEAIKLGAVGAVQAKLPLKNIKGIEVPFLPVREREETVAKLNDVLAAIQINLAESLALGELRDSLLPKLMSGEIGVSKVDITQLNNHLGDCY